MDNEVILRTERIRKEFAGVVALDDISIEITKGECRAIIGPNGSGKTTLINVLSGALKPTSGKVYLKGEDITGLPQYIIARKGIVKTHQYTQIFPNLTILENLWIAAQSKNKLNLFRDYKKNIDIKKKVENILKLIGLDYKSEYTVSKCSYGEQRRVQIGMALLTDPEIILMDEPTSGISPKERDDIVDLLSKLTKDNKTLVIVEHNVDVVLQLADIVTVLNNGRVIAEGTPDEVINMPEIREIYIGGSKK